MEVKNGSVLLDYKVFANITSVSKILANKSTPTSEKNEEIMEDVNNGVSEENNAPVPLDIPIKHVTKETVVSDDEDEYVNELEPDDESSENLENTEEAVMKFPHGKKTLVLMSDGLIYVENTQNVIYTMISTMFSPPEKIQAKREKLKMQKFMKPKNPSIDGQYILEVESMENPKLIKLMTVLKMWLSC